MTHQSLKTTFVITHQSLKTTFADPSVFKDNLRDDPSVFKEHLCDDTPVFKDHLCEDSSLIKDHLRDDPPVFKNHLRDDPRVFKDHLREDSSLIKDHLLKQNSPQTATSRSYSPKAKITLSWDHLFFYTVLFVHPHKLTPHQGPPSQINSIQNISALGQAHMPSIPSLSSFPCLAFETSNGLVHNGNFWSFQGWTV